VFAIVRSPFGDSKITDDDKSAGAWILDTKWGACQTSTVAKDVSDEHFALLTTADVFCAWSVASLDRLSLHIHTVRQPSPDFRSGELSIIAYVFRTRVPFLVVVRVTAGQLKFVEGPRVYELARCRSAI